ncbi:hypothetical protein EVAR_43505_1 [Eumeta japonica]|uniref:Uncharacterized protein n=1 Tax=Eumeta variegata TaxID=151549 RepID=A0A4C1YLT3_EUMVA|nr:hypothetical protein EVAR_43505_1 [Eumeta japonica]
MNTGPGLTGNQERQRNRFTEGHSPHQSDLKHAVGNWARQARNSRTRSESPARTNAACVPAPARPQHLAHSIIIMSFDARKNVLSNYACTLTARAPLPLAPNYNLNIFAGEGVKAIAFKRSAGEREHGPRAGAGADGVSGRQWPRPVVARPLQMPDPEYA